MANFQPGDTVEYIPTGQVGLRYIGKIIRCRGNVSSKYQTTGHMPDTCDIEVTKVEQNPPRYKPGDKMEVHKLSLRSFTMFPTGETVARKKAMLKELTALRKVPDESLIEGGRRQKRTRRTRRSRRRSRRV